MAQSHAAPDADVILDGARRLFDGERDPMANAATLVAYLASAIPRQNWIGFYFVRGGELVLGPFAGQPAVTRIAFGRGVCGSAWASAETLVVDDVNAFENHIACDRASRSEIVVPLARDGVVYGVFDCDSPVIARFGDRERSLFERLAALYLAASDLL